ncbi:STAS domain-containing protein [Nitrincola sp. MINF-07-Sa-05]|uniref:STAS domain-containing protein n=1 Tax=Nitrincola salilacus TaxID=3400273 RepID=UPI0039184BCB
MASNQTEISCGEVLGIAQAAVFHSQLSDAWEHSLAVRSAIRIDISGLNQVDAAGMQLLYGFQRDASAKGIELHWSEPTPALRDAVNILGIPEFYKRAG